jgi:hypothetical protein
MNKPPVPGVGEKANRMKTYGELLGRMSEIAAAKLSIPICIYVTSPGQLSFRLIGALRRSVIVGLSTLD